MPAISPTNRRVEGCISMDMTTKKMLRGAFYLATMGGIAYHAISKASGNVWIIAGIFLLGALLVYGIEINTISIGSLEIDFGDGD